MPVKSDHVDMSTETGAGDSKTRATAAQTRTQEIFETRPPSRNTLQLVASGAGLIVAVAAVITLLFAVWSYKSSTEMQVQLLALGSLQHYLDLGVQYPELASGSKVDARYPWFAAEALTTAQTLWILVGQQADWQRAINAIIRQNPYYLRSGTFVCDDFMPSFVSYLRVRVLTLKCAEYEGTQ